MMYENLIKKLNRSVNVKYGARVAVERELLSDAANAIKELIGDCNMYSKAMTYEHNRAAKLAWEYRWIPVTARLPEEEGEVLCINDYHYYLVGWLYYSENSEDYICESDGEVLLGVTYWMPCPKPPESERE